MTVATVVIWLLVAVASAWVCARVAADKGRNTAGYAALGFVFPLIGIIVALVVPRR